MVSKQLKLDHIGLIVPDMQKALRYYQETLGFTVKAHFKSQYGMEFYYIENNGLVYELQANPNLPISSTNKIDHIAYESKDIKADYEYYKSKGAKFATNGIGYLDFIWDNGVYFFMMLSDTDEIVEFCQKG